MVPTSFVKIPQDVSKYQRLRTAFEVTNDRVLHRDEDAAGIIVEVAPLLTTQFVLSGLVYINALVQLLDLVPTMYATRIRLQCFAIIVGTKLIDTIQELDISQFESRDDLFIDDLLDRAKSEMKALASGKTSRSLAFYLICMLSNSHASGSLIPFLISEFPSMLRYGTIIAALSTPKREREKKTIRTLTRKLFPSAISTNQNRNSSMGRHNTNNTHINVTTIPSTGNDMINNNGTYASIDEICDIGSSAIEICVLSHVLYRLFDFRSESNPTRDVKDFILLIAQVLLIQNFLSMRVMELTKRCGYGGVWNLLNLLVRHTPLMNQAIEVIAPTLLKVEEAMKCFTFSKLQGHVLTILNAKKVKQRKKYIPKRKLNRSVNSKSKVKKTADALVIQ